MTAPGIAVVTHNSASALRRFAGGHVKLAETLGVPLVILDNASTDETLALLSGLGSDGLRVIRSPRNLGYAAGVNRAAAGMPGRDFLLLNPDVEAPEPAGLAALSRLLTEDEHAAVVAPSLVEGDGARQPSARRFPSALAMIGSKALAARVPVVGRARERYQEPSWADSATKVDWAIGAAMLIRRAAFDELGGWDERYFLYMEDVDYCRRCARAGWDVWFEPAVRLQHGYERASTAADATVLRSVARRRHLAGMARFFAGEPRMLFGRGRR